MKPRNRLQPGELDLVNRVLRDVAVLLDATAVACAWCARVMELKPGEPDVSHSMCQPCYEREYAQEIDYAH